MKVVIPADAEPGSHELRLVGTNSQGGVHINVAKIEIQTGASVLSASQQSSDSQPGTGGISLPKTGIAVVAIILLAVVLTVVGVTLIGNSEESGEYNWWS